VSDALDPLQPRLERATARECPGDGSLDAETASLREGWLALGELLQAIEPSAERPFELRALPKDTRRVGRPATALAALAACLLVAVTLAGTWMTMTPRGAGRPLSFAKEPVGEKTTAHAGPAVAQREELQPESLPDSLVWDDPLDQQIASVAQQVVRIQQDWDQVDGAFGPVYHGLEEMAEELEQTRL
jgi:hypothetical protein